MTGKRKRAVRVANGPSLGRKRPRRAATSTREVVDVATHKLRVRCTNFNPHGGMAAERRRGNSYDAHLRTPRGGSWFTWTQKKAVRGANGPSPGRKRPRWAVTCSKLQRHENPYRCVRANRQLLRGRIFPLSGQLPDAVAVLPQTCGGTDSEQTRDRGRASNGRPPATVLEAERPTEARASRSRDWPRPRGARTRCRRSPQ